MNPQGLPPLRKGDPPVHIYKNLLCLPLPLRGVARPATPEAIENLRGGKGGLGRMFPVDVSLKVRSDPSKALRRFSAPAAGLTL